MHATHWFLPWILLSTCYHLRVAQLKNRRNLYNKPSRPRGRSHSQCCCVAFSGAVIVITTTSFSFSHACACHVYIHVCMYVYLPKLNKQMHYKYYDPYRSTMGIFLQYYYHLFWNKICVLLSRHEKIKDFYVRKEFGVIAR